MSAVGVLVAHPQRLFVDAIGRALSRYSDLVLSEGCLTGLETVREASRTKPDVVLIDYWIPQMYGPAVTRVLRNRLPEIEVLFLADYYVGPPQLQEASECGALGFVRKNVPVRDVVDAIHAAAGRQPPRQATVKLAPEAPSEGRRAARKPPSPTTGLRGEEAQRRLDRLLTMTPREVEIVQLLSFGLPANDLARELSITPGTLKNHIRKIMMKTQALTPLDLINMAAAEGLISQLSPPTSSWTHHNPTSQPSEGV